MHPIAFFLQFVVHIACVTLLNSELFEKNHLIDRKKRHLHVSSWIQLLIFSFFSVVNPMEMSNYLISKLIMEIQPERSLGE